MREIFFIAWNDAKFQLRQRGTLVWVFVMPPILFYFIGTVTGGFASGLSGGQATPITVIAEAPGFLQEQIDLRLQDNDFAPELVEELLVTEGEDAPRRTLTIAANLSDQIAAGEEVAVSFET